MRRLNLEGIFSRHKKWIIFGLLAPVMASAVYYPWLQVGSRLTFDNTVIRSTAALDIRSANSLNVYTDNSTVGVPVIISGSDGSAGHGGDVALYPGDGTTTGGNVLMTIPVGGEIKILKTGSAPSVGQAFIASNVDGSGYYGTLALNKLAATTVSKALVSDASGFITTSATTDTEIGYVSGATSNLQAQISALSVGGTNASPEITNLSFNASVAASALTIDLKTKAGSDASALSPITIGFRSATSTSGTYVQRSVTAALQLVISNGSKLGGVNGVASDYYIYAIDNAGTVELAISGILFDESVRQSTTSEGGAGAADTRYVLYSTTARTNVAIRLIGRITATEATAGVWLTAPAILAVSPLENKVITSDAAHVPIRIESARMTCSAGSSVDVQNGSWVASIGNVSAGACIVTTQTGYWVQVPVCVVSPETLDGSSDPQSLNVVSGTSSITVDCASNSGADCSTYVFDLICTGYAY